jgi:hypothetical protein
MAATMGSGCGCTAALQRLDLMSHKVGDRAYRIVIALPIGIAATLLLIVGVHALRQWERTLLRIGILPMRDGVRVLEKPQRRIRGRIARP